MSKKAVNIRNAVMSATVFLFCAVLIATAQVAPAKILYHCKRNYEIRPQQCGLSQKAAKQQTYYLMIHDSGNMATRLDFSDTSNVRLETYTAVIPASDPKRRSFFVPAWNSYVSLIVYGVNGFQLRQASFVEVHYGDYSDFYDTRSDCRNYIDLNPSQYCSVITPA